MTRGKLEQTSRLSSEKKRSRVDNLEEALRNKFPDGRWLAALELFLPTGVADTGQIQAVTGLSYDRLTALLNCFHELALKFGSLARRSHLPGGGRCEKGERNAVCGGRSPKYGLDRRGHCPNRFSRARVSASLPRIERQAGKNPPLPTEQRGRPATCW